MIPVIGALLCGTISTYFLWLQRQKVERLGTESISVASNILVCGMFLGFGIYAIHTTHVVLMITCAMRILVYIPLLESLYRKNHGFKKSEWIAVAVVLMSCSASAVSAGFAPWAFIGFHCVGYFGQWKQIKKLYGAKSPGVLDVRLQIVYFLACVFWCILGPQLLTILSALFVIEYSIIIFLWCWYRFKTPRLV